MGSLPECLNLRKLVHVNVNVDIELYSMYFMYQSTGELKHLYLIHGHLKQVDINQYFWVFQIRGKVENIYFYYRNTLQLKILVFIRFIFLFEKFLICTLNQIFDLKRGLFSLTFYKKSSSYKLKL